MYADDATLYRAASTRHKLHLGLYVLYDRRKTNKLALIVPKKYRIFGS